MAKKTISPRTLTIGLPIYNEEQSLPQFMAALERAVEQLPPDVKLETIACPNGCKDRSEEILKEIAASPMGARLNLKIISSSKGKLNAQFAIAQQREQQGPLCYMDADTLPRTNTLKLLYDELDRDANCYASFARVEPYYTPEKLQNMSPFEDMLRVYYKSRDYLPPKPYIHGRTFMLRDAAMIKEMERMDWKARADKVEDRQLVSSLNLEQGPWADDVYLSRAVAHRFGAQSIHEVPAAKVFFHPPQHQEDYFSGMRRLLLELTRMKLLCPEFGYLEKGFGKNNSDDHAAVLEANLTPEEMTKLKQFKALEKQYEESVAKAIEERDYDSLSQDDLWSTVQSSKQSFVQLAAAPELLPYDAEMVKGKATSVLVVPFTQAGEVVSIKNKRGWDLPGGHIESTDGNYAATARREAREEANITLRSLKPCGLIKFNDSEHLDSYMVVMTGMVDSIAHHTPNSEVMERKILPPSDFLANCTPENRALMQEVLAAAHTTLGVASYQGVSKS